MNYVYGPDLIMYLLVRKTGFLINKSLKDDIWIIIRT
nr:MAG TPA_asm: hypothetical protein [Caudoviricetes sp.]